MPAKDWEARVEDEDYIEWVHKEKEDSYIEVYKEYNKWICRTPDEKYHTLNTRLKAISFAKSYMRKH